MNPNRIDINWRAPGPVSAAFMASMKRVQIINGPIGGGKTTTNFMKHIRYAARQMQSTRDGIRKYKVCVVRDTYRQLWKTTLPTWWKRVPKNEGEFVGSENAPASHRVTFQLKDGTWVDMLVEFIAIGENSVEDVMRGYEPTAWLLNEMDLLAREVYNYARGRWGRYPDMAEGGPSWWGITGDANAPTEESWLYTDIFDATVRPADVDLFIQPSGFSPLAENVENLPPGYYVEQATGQPQWYIKRMIENQPGYSRAGKPIYPEFNDQLHVSNEVRVLPGLPLLIGLDAGMSPAAVFEHRLPNGAWWLIDELVGEKGMGARRFGALLAKKLGQAPEKGSDVDFRSCRTIRGTGDPSAAYGADKKDGEQDWIDIVSAVAGIQISAAPTNRLIPRLEAVRKPLTTLIDGKPGFEMHERCRMVRRGFNSGYRFRKLILGAEEKYSDEPEKNEYSHPHDALQYNHLGGGEDMEIRDREARARRDLVRQASQCVSDWDPFNPQRP
jgi:hypothetical protein